MEDAGRYIISKTFSKMTLFSLGDTFLFNQRLGCLPDQVMPRFLTHLIWLVLSVVLFSFHGYTQAAPSIMLSPEEKKWLAAHPVVRIGVDAEYAPYSFIAADGRYQGVAPDLIDRISLISGIRFEIIPNLTWPQILQGAKARSLDVVATAVRTEERDNYLNFTDVYIPTPLVIMTRKNDDRITTALDLRGKKIALVKGYSSSKKVMNEYPTIQPNQVDTSLEGLRAVAAGVADAYVGVLGVSAFQASKHGIINLKVAAPYEMVFNGQRIGVRKDWPELVSILDKSIKAIPENEKISTLKKWVPIDMREKQSPELNLSDNEKRWLSQHKQIRLAIDPDFAPVEFIDRQGNYSGISADYVQKLSSKLGITMKVVPDITWSQALDLAKKGEIDVFAAITPTDERTKYLNFSNPYFKYPVVIYTQSDFHVISGLDSLTHKKIAVVKDYFVHELLRQNHPELELIPFDSTYAGLSSVSTGRIDAFVGDIATATFVLRKYNLTNLKIAAPTDIDSSGHAFGVRKDWPEMVGILNKAMDSMRPEEHLAIRHKWIDIEVEKFPRYWIWIALTAAGLVVVFIVLSTVLRIQVRNRTAELDHKNQLLEKENSERKRAEQALVDSEQRLTQFFHATFEMVFFHEGGQILDVNPATMKMTGYTLNELIGRNLLEFVEQKSRSFVMSKMADGGIEPYEANIITKSGSIMPVEIHAENINKDGEVARVVSLRDITERKKSEEALQHAYDVLEVKVEERTAELSLANSKLKELDQLKSMFIASVSHELRTPLNSIIGFSDMMMRGTFGELGDKYQDYITRINHSGQHLLSLITDIIDISKIESGRIDLELSDFELHEVVIEAVNNIREQAESKGLKLEVDIQQGLQLYTDKRRLLQCILNFLSNAVKYSEDGKITVSAKDRGDKFMLLVRDTGIGISEKDMPRLFDAFERIDSHLRVKAGGTGLGLYLTKKVVSELLQGEIHAQSKLGSGSTFWIEAYKNIQPKKALAYS